MIVLLIFIYLAIGFTIACVYNALTDCSMPPDMTESEKNVMFGNILFWPIISIIWFIRRSIKYIKWLFSNEKS